MSTSVKKVNPPLIKAILYPTCFKWWMSSSEPGVSCRSAAISCRVDRGIPFKRRTLWQRDSLKSISPFIARSVIALTCSSTPAKLAKRLMISKSTMVMSISKTMSLFSFRDLPSSWINTSSPRPSHSFLSCDRQSSAVQSAKSIKNSMEISSPRAVTEALSRLTPFLAATSATSRMIPGLSLARMVTIYSSLAVWRRP